VATLRALAVVAVAAVGLAVPLASAAPGAPSCSKPATAEGDVGSYLRVRTCSAYLAGGNRYRPARYRLVSGSLPPGLALWGDGSPAAQVDGMPRKAGTYRFTVAATDALGGRATGSYTVHIHPRLELAGGSLGSAAVGVPYWKAVGVRGGKPPYRFGPFRLSGLTLDRSTGVLSGTASRTGGRMPASCPFMLTVTDATGARASAEFRLGLLDERGRGPFPASCDPVGLGRLTWVRSIEPRRGPIPAAGPRTLVEIAPVTISGTGLRNVTAVSFAGTRAVFEIHSDRSITAIPPRGARTGPIKLRTADGRIRNAGIYRVFFGG
jgi:hypothetical protein